MVRMIKMVHKPLLEVTNGGNVFADCSCGESMGVYRDRQTAKDAVRAHAGGESSTVGKVGTTFLVGPSIQGMVDTGLQ